MARSRSLALAAVMALAACAPSPPPVSGFSLHIESVDGPGRLTIELNGVRQGTIDCGGVRDLEPGRGGIPALPWDLRLINVGGEQFGRVNVDGRSGDQLIVRLGGIILGPSGPIGPAPLASCPIAP